MSTARRKQVQQAHAHQKKYTRYMYVGLEKGKPAYAEELEFEDPAMANLTRNLSGSDVMKLLRIAIEEEMPDDRKDPSPDLATLIEHCDEVGVRWEEIDDEGDKGKFDRVIFYEMDEDNDK
jgi:hypothetical protein